MKTEFIPYEQALELKELGFNEPCFGYFDKEDDNTLKFDVCYETKNLAAPTFSQAFRWFREKYNMFGKIQPYDDVNTLKMAWEYVILDINWGSDYEVHFNCRLGLFKTSDEAELACLNKLIEIVKNK